jgi:DNA-binding transcriptional ArsR family regulator
MNYGIRSWHQPACGVLADPGRAAMLWALMDGSARPAGELALIAGLSASSTSGHLTRLSEGGLLVVETRGRNRYYRLATPEIGVAIEALATASLASQPPRMRAVPVSRTTPPALKQARTATTIWPGNLLWGFSNECRRRAGSPWTARGST